MRTFCPKEYKIVALRECPLPEAMPVCDTPDRAAEYWRTHVVNHPAFNPDVECFVVLLLNTRRVMPATIRRTGTIAARCRLRTLDSRITFGTVAGILSTWHLRRAGRLTCLLRRCPTHRNDRGVPSRAGGQ